MQGRESTKAIRERAINLLTERLRLVGFQVQPAPPGFLVDLLIRRRGEPLLVKVLATAAPHHRGGTGSLGLHWMLSETGADQVALVDLSRASCWLLSLADFKERAQPVVGGRHHLDWIVVPLGKYSSGVPKETEFDKFKLGR